MLLTGFDRTRNARLGTIRSFYRFVALEDPKHPHTIARVMSIPDQAPRAQHRLLPRSRGDQGTARCTRPKATWLGRRGHALLVLMVQTGVRVSELVGLRVCDIQLGTSAHI
jgi:integrase/recombinase XerD